MELTEELRKEHGIGDAQPLYLIHTIFNEEELRRAIYTTRQRERLRNCAVWLTVAAVCLSLAYIFQTQSGIGGAALCIVLCLERLIKARQFTDEQIGKMYKKFGFSGEDQTLYFFDEKITVLNHIYESCHVYDYSHYTKLYLKKDFLFLCKQNNHGQFVRYADIPDMEGLIALLKEKCPGLKCCK